MMPKVAVILASFNGAKYIEEQIRSIFAQTGVCTHLYVFDDRSTDGTQAILARLKDEFDFLTFVVNPRPSGSAFSNFYGAIKRLDTSPFDYVAFSDQDDIWAITKLKAQISAMSLDGSQASSTSVTAFSEAGDRDYLDNSGRQTPIDYLFTGGGQGCTYLIEQPLFGLLQGQIRTLDPTDVPHDWLIYALVRYQGYRWTILPESLLDYRQHDNVFGSRNGIRGKVFRAKMISSGKFKTDRILLMNYIFDSRLPRPAAAEADQVPTLEGSLLRRTKFALKSASEFRRFRRQSWLMAVFFILGWA